MVDKACTFQCSATCGKGVRNRTVTCITTGEPCSFSNQPETEKICESQLCDSQYEPPNPVWMYTEWSRKVWTLYVTFGCSIKFTKMSNDNRPTSRLSYPLYSIVFSGMRQWIWDPATGLQSHERITLRIEAETGNYESLRTQRKSLQHCQVVYRALVCGRYSERYIWVEPRSPGAW